jgi:hypothetical protein
MAERPGGHRWAAIFLQCLGYPLGRAGGWWVAAPPGRANSGAIGSPSALRTKKPRTGGAGGRGGSESTDPVFFFAKARERVHGQPLDTYLRAPKPASGPPGPAVYYIATSSPPPPRTSPLSSLMGDGCSGCSVLECPYSLLAGAGSTQSSVSIQSVPGARRWPTHLLLARNIPLALGARSPVSVSASRSCQVCIKRLSQKTTGSTDSPPPR